MKAILIALIASLGYGIASPIAKVAFNKGMHPDGFALSYAIGLLAFVVYTSFQKGFGILYPTPSVFIWGLLAGILCAVGFKATSVALAIPTSLVAVVMVIVATYPVISSAISLPLLKEAGQVILPKLLVGTALVIGGGYLVSTSIK